MAKKKMNPSPLRRTNFTLGRRVVNRLDLYELCVQDPAMESAFVRAVHGGNPTTLGEDFCGPASVARAWCGLSPRHRAVAIDRDAGPLAHARERAKEHDALAESPIGPRLVLKRGDVLRVSATPSVMVDAIAAFNFAVCELHERRDLVRYLNGALRRLRPRGVLAADLYAGTEQFSVGTYRKSIRTPDGVVKYSWEQRQADPFSARVVNAIHFELPPSGTVRGPTRLIDAFVYHWRLWSIAELRDAMHEAGFASTQVHTSYGDGLDTEGNLYVSPVATDREGADSRNLESNMVAYVVGRKATGRRLRA